MNRCHEGVMCRTAQTGGERCESYGETSMRGQVRTVVLLMAALTAAAALAQSDQSVEQRASGATAPLPDVAAMMRQVEINQRNAEAVEKTYLSRTVVVRTEVD